MPAAVAGGGGGDSDGADADAAAGPCLVVGVTGGIASGKSTLLHFVREHRGFPTIDADIIGHQCYDQVRACERACCAAWTTHSLLRTCSSCWCCLPDGEDTDAATDGDNNNNNNNNTAAAAIGTESKPDAWWRLRLACFRLPVMLHCRARGVTGTS